MAKPITMAFSVRKISPDTSRQTWGKQHRHGRITVAVGYNHGYRITTGQSSARDGVNEVIGTGAVIPLTAAGIRNWR
ncbi:MAG: hypothetical protein U0X91_31130 [Spirosomataceae bacterium]